MTMTEHDQQSALLGKIAAYTELLVNDPRSTIFVSLAEAYRKMGFFNDAREIIVKGLELHPDFGPAYVVLARIECQLDHVEASCAAFERALALDPDSLAALVGYARVKLLLQRDDEARDLLLHARSLSPADPVINKMLLGLAPQPEAEEEPAAVVAFVPPPVNKLTALASTTLADLYLAQGLSAKALTLYRQLLTRNPDNLELRRKIREIEGRVEAPSLPPADKVVTSPSLTTTAPMNLEEQHLSEPFVDEAPVQENDSVSTPAVSDDEMDLEVAQTTTIFRVACEDEVSTECEAVEDDLAMETASVSADSTEIINQLNNWLNNIRLRREHV